MTQRLSIIFSRDVIFNETSRGVKTEQEENRLIQIKMFLEEESELENSNQDRKQDEDETEHSEVKTSATGQLPQ